MKVVFYLVIFLIGFSFVAAEFGYNDPQGPILAPEPPLNHSNFPTVNSSDYWITGIGTLGTVNATQFNNLGEVLNIDESWISSLWCRLTGCTMTGDITFNTGSINNVTNITLIDSIKDSDSESRTYFDSEGAFVVEG
jgi:hypothetical protein